MDDVQKSMDHEEKIRRSMDHI